MFGSELNYQKAMGSANRLEIGGRWSSYNNFRGTGLLGLRTGTRWNYISAVGVYQWHWNISPSAANGGFNWYAGPGAVVGLRTWEIFLVGDKIDDGSDLFVNVGGQIGIEYNLNVQNVPLVLSIDMRPMFGLMHSMGFGYDVAFAARYTF
jgi:hypothetical protein